MTTSLKVIQRIEDNVESGKPVHIELTIFDICMVGFELRVRLKLVCDLLGDLDTAAVLVRHVLQGRSRRNWRRPGRAGSWHSRCQVTHQCFGFLDMFEAEKELTIQVAQVNRVEIDDVDFTKAGEEEVL